MFTRASSYSYSCARCGSCCRNQAIQLNGYEIARLAQALGVSTTSFIETHADNQGQFLRFGDDGACPFLSAQGCRAHADRPLLCRLYPLGREWDQAQGERFTTLARPAACRGREGQEGRLAGYLEEQGAGEFLRAAQLYLEAVEQALAQDARPLPPLWQWYDIDRLLGDGAAGTGGAWQKLEAQLRTFQAQGLLNSLDLTWQLQCS